jgi:gliding motility-associated-like protein
MKIQITPRSTADAGPDMSSCGSSPVPLVGAATNYSSLVWSTSGSGTFNNPGILNTVYTPSPVDIASGQVILTLTTNAGAPCSAVSDNMTLVIPKAAVANAGPDQSICQDNPYTISGASTQNQSSILWTHNGLGTLTGANTITPTYNPAAGETGQVTLTLTVTPFAPCQVVTDQMILTISKSSTAYAGSDAASCGTDLFPLSGATASNFQSLTWTTSGTGTFDDVHVVNPVYNPSSADVLSGMVVLTMTTDPYVSCAIITSHMTLTLNRTPIADAGQNGISCSGSPFTVTGATAQNYGTILWTTNGGGILSGQTTLTPTYTPAAGESGTIVLTMTIHGTGGCFNLTETSQINIVICPAILVNAGSDQTIPVNMATMLAGHASGGAGVLTYSWQPSSLLVDATTAHPQTVQLMNDVTFVLTVTDQSTGCQTSDSVRIILVHGIEAINAVKDYDTTAVNIPKDISVLSNDSYSAGQAVTVTLYTPPTRGSASVFSDNKIRYTPSPGISGKDSLSYIVCYDQYPEVCDTTEVYIFIGAKFPIDWFRIHNVITPNGDGDNDTWFIEGIEEFPENSILIFNRWGDEVRSFEHYNNSSVVWKGDNFKEEPLPDGTYYYILTIQDVGVRTGWVLIRGGLK